MKIGRYVIDALLLAIILVGMIGVLALTFVDSNPAFAARAMDTCWYSVLTAITALIGSHWR